MQVLFRILDFSTYTSQTNQSIQIWFGWPSECSLMGIYEVTNNPWFLTLFNTVKRLMMATLENKSCNSIKSHIFFIEYWPKLSRYLQSRASRCLPLSSSSSSSPGVLLKHELSRTHTNLHELSRTHYLTKTRTPK